MREKEKRFKLSQKNERYNNRECYEDKWNKGEQL